jgi:uncharacterized protein YdeI (YjbR/CyaY-like superfamily)
MGKLNPAVDAYIRKSADFARPILNHLRQLVHRESPEAHEEIKWGFPFFMYNGPLAHMAAFKRHCSFGFWKFRIREALMSQNKDASGMGQFGRITSLKDLPPDAFIRTCLKEAKRQRDEGIKPAKKTAVKKTPIRIPNDLRKALATNSRAQETFKNFSYSHKKEYVQWITEAKRLETRVKRIQKTLAMLSARKSLNWKYESKK